MNEAIAEQLRKIAKEIDNLSMIADGSEFETSMDLGQLRWELLREASLLTGE